jgi:hypothetical protein
MINKPKANEIVRLWGAPYPVAIVALIWGIVAGLACAWALNALPLPHAFGIVVISGVVGGIAIALALKRWPPSSPGKR